MCWRRAITIAAAPDANRTARTFVVDAICTAIGQRASIADDAELVVSELVANAMNAGATTAMLSLDLHHSHLRLAVEDDADGVPALKHAAATDDHGRGLEIVAGLSSGWGVSERPPGKEVWADLPVAPAFTRRQFACSAPHTAA